MPEKSAAKPEWSEVGPDHPMTKMMNSLVDGHYQLCSDAKITPMEFLSMLANVQGVILGLQDDLPTDQAIGRADTLAAIIRSRIHAARAPATTDSVN